MKSKYVLLYFYNFRCLFLADLPNDFCCFKSFHKKGVSQNHQIRCSSGTLVLYYEKIWILSFCFRNFLDFGHTLIKLLFFLAFMLFLLLEKDDSQYAHFGFLHAVY